MKEVGCEAMLVCNLCACFVASQKVSKRLTNQDTIDMVKHGLSNDVIIAKIRSAHGHDQLAFDTDLAGLKSLKAASVPAGGPDLKKSRFTSLCRMGLALPTMYSSGWRRKTIAVNFK